MGPLAGIKIVDLSQVISGPFAAGWLADQGADVIKIEDERGDLSRLIGPKKEEMSALFFAINRGKRSIVLDLKSDKGRETLWALIEQADVFMENFRPGVTERLGFGYEAVAKRAPKLVYCSISGFGAKGPRAGARVYDSIMQAAAGLADSQCTATSGPELIRTFVCDKTTSIVAAQAITAALFARERSGKGQLVELNMYDTAVALLWPEGMFNHSFMDDPPADYPDIGLGYRLWPTKDGHVALAGPADAEFRAICNAVGQPEMAQDDRFNTFTGRQTNRTEYQAWLADAVSRFTTDELDARLVDADAAGGRVNSRKQMIDDPQTKANGTIIEIDAGTLGRVRAARHPAKFHGTPLGPARAAPRHGEHTKAIEAEAAAHKSRG